ncbi:MAG TPA: Gmad2 immunoglobulin-like domain-containing protein [Frankiaceae bacterium]|nr:Gmad2 immunoglobulin-like domain-containing protein [Frankiaceae bacterium]
MSRPRRTTALLALLAIPALAALSACGTDRAPAARASGDPTSPPASATTTTSAPPASSASSSASTSPSAPATSARVGVYYLGTGGGKHPRPVLFREFRAVNAAAGADRIRAAVAAMLHDAPADRDYSSLWPRSTKVLGVTISGDVATVNLSSDAQSASASSSQEGASVQQLVHTVTAAAPAVRGVRLRFDGRTRDSLWGHVDTSGTLRRAPAIDWLAAVWVVEPGEGARVGRTFTVDGVATVFEGSVSWHVTQGGRTLASGAAQATEGAPGRGTFRASVTLPRGTTGNVVFTAFESSAEDGRMLNPDTKTFVVG